ncbi:MAG: DUF1460 domain-containing protein [Rickettsiella sp.]|nr:DUF1460 domain-containing protein [Rickettsiella sp.]
MSYRYLIFLYLFLVSLDSFACFQFNDQAAIQLITLNKKKSLQRRSELASDALLGSFYQSGALGEGSMGKYDQYPLYRFDGFDCETYVDTVVALVLASNFPDFKKKLNQIRYKHGQVDFFKRNHFPSADWIPNNKRNGFIQELTYAIAGSKAKISTALISRKSWYSHLSVDRIHVPFLSSLEKEVYLAQLKKEGINLASNERINIAYIPVREIMQNVKLLRRIPTGSLIFLVGHDDYLTYQIGTQMNVLHMGFAIWDNGQLFLRMASSRAERVLDVRLQDYLETYRALDTLKGISIWGIKST